MDDIRAHSPTDHVLAGIELLHRLSLLDADTDADGWFQPAREPWLAAKRPAPALHHHAHDPHMPFELDEAEACDPSMYDPFLFPPSPSQPASPTHPVFSIPGDRRKPLPPPPPSSSLSLYRPSPPSTPRLTPASTPSSSPRASISPSYSLPLPRSRPPSTNLGTPRSLHTHGAFPSISSTLSLLEERESENAKRSGVLVDSEDGRASPDSTILVHSMRRASRESVVAATTAIAKKPRPTLNLSTSASSPQLRTLADLASVPASPISVSSSSHSIAHKPSLVSLVPSVSSPLAGPHVLLPPADDVSPASRWSIDSIVPDAGRRPSIPSTPVTPPSPPPKTPRRSRLLSFISRGRASSVGKREQPLTPTIEACEMSMPVPVPMTPSGTSGSRRTSRSGSYPPPPLSLSASTSTMSSGSSVCTGSTLPTPADSQSDVTLDPFCPASPSFSPASFLPEADDFLPDMLNNGSGSGGYGYGENDEDEDGRTAEAKPTASTSSFFHIHRDTLPAPPPPPSTPTSGGGIPFLSALARRKLRRRKKKLVITLSPEEPHAQAYALGEVYRTEKEQRRREDGVVRWCESFGAVRRFERRPDGSLHVYWRDWEVADMVCRVSAQVYIKGVGRVSLAWHYLN